MSKERVLHIGVAPREWIKRRTIAIAKGEIKPSPSEPRIWFTSMDSLAKVFSEKNMLLIEIIRNSQPKSLAELAGLSGRAKSNLSATLRNMERYGYVEFEAAERGRKIPKVKYDRLNVDVRMAA